MAADDDIPRLDAVPGWPLPEAQPDWYGGPEPERALLETWRSGRMHHAWLIGGQKGIGKATLAYRLARFILAHPDPAEAARVESLALPPEHRVFRQVAAGAHPNLLSLQRPWDDKNKRYKTFVTVDEIRRIQQFFGTTPGEGAWRIAVVDPADEMNENAANALLKMLEEPPKQSLFLVVSHAPGRLLPTIRSRCRRLDLPPLPVATIESALAIGAPDASAADRRTAAELAGGSLRRAILILDSDAAEIHRRFRALAANLPDYSVEGAHALGDAVAARGEGEAWAAFLDSLFDWLSRRVRNQPEPEGAAVGQAVLAAPLVTWADVWENVSHLTVEAEEYNLDKKQIVLSIFMTLARATRM